MSVLEENIENKAPDKVYASFESFFHQYAIANNINLKWKNSIITHLKSIDCFKDSSKWIDGIRHFGL